MQKGRGCKLLFWLIYCCWQSGQSDGLFEAVKQTGRLCEPVDLAFTAWLTLSELLIWRLYLGRIAEGPGRYSC